MLMGLVLDSAIGGYPMGQAYSPATRTVSFATYLSAINAWGVPLPTLGRLLRSERFGDALADVLAGLHATYDADGGNEFQRAWRFYMRHRARFHLGSRAWPIAFGSWPVLPVLDRKLLETAAGIPPASLGDRRARPSWSRAGSRPSRHCLSTGTPSTFRRCVRAFGTSCVEPWSARSGIYPVWPPSSEHAPRPGVTCGSWT